MNGTLLFAVYSADRAEPDRWFPWPPDPPARALGERLGDFQ